MKKFKPCKAITLNHASCKNKARPDMPYCNNHRYTRDAIPSTRVRKEFTKQERRRVIRTYGNICYLCNQKINYAHEWHIDHVIPFSQGGNDTMTNLRPTHPKCNMDKGDAIGNHKEYLRQYNIPLTLYPSMIIESELKALPTKQEIIAPTKRNGRKYNFPVTITYVQKPTPVA